MIVPENAGAKAEEAEEITVAEEIMAEGIIITGEEEDKYKYTIDSRQAIQKYVKL